MARPNLLGDLIYMTAARLEMGILQTYELDFDVAGEKDFEIKCSDYVMENNWFWFVDGTEYGGRIDSIASNTAESSITYTGRNWRGILSSRYILTGASKSPVGASGDISDEINTRLSKAGLNTLFKCDAPEYDVEPGETVDLDVTGYDYPTNCTVYDGIILLAREVNMKLLFEFRSSDHMVHIIPTSENDYSDYLTYCKDNAVEFEISKTTGGVNHVICYGDDDDGKHRMIHIFTDEEGNVQPYATVDNPTKDSHYILDQSKRVLEGFDEVQMVLSTSASAKENYELLTSKPKDWATNYAFYYQIDDSDNDTDTGDDAEETDVQYTEVEGQDFETYTVLTSKPKDWDTNFGNYYVKASLDPDDYTEVSAGSTETTYSRVYKKPKNWNTTYSYYYYRKSVDDTYTYESYPAKTSVKYVKLVKKPVSWASKCTNYYRKKGKKYVKVTKIKHVMRIPNGFYKTKRIKKNGLSLPKPKYKIWKTWYTAPKWKKNTFYKKTEIEKIPGFGSQGAVYKLKSVKSTAPTFYKNNFYKKTEGTMAPAWKKGFYYKQVLDHYASMVEEALQNLKDYANQDSQTVVLEGFDVTVGDYVGGTDEVTGFELSERVTNIIVKFNAGLQSEIEYEIGGESDISAAKYEEDDE